TTGAAPVTTTGDPVVSIRPSITADELLNAPPPENAVTLAIVSTTAVTVSAAERAKLMVTSKRTSPKPAGAMAAARKSTGVPPATSPAEKGAFRLAAVLE